MSEQSNPFDTTEATPAGRALRAWAADRSPEVRAAADALAQSLWANASNPPSDLMKADLLKRNADFERAKAGE